MKKSLVLSGITAAAAMVLACVTLLSACDLNAILEMLPTPEPWGTEETSTPTEEPSATPMPFQVSFDENEVFADEASKEAAEIIDGSIKMAVELLNSAYGRFEFDVEDLDYSTLPTERDKLKDPLSVEFYDKILEHASKFENYSATVEEYGMDLFYVMTPATDALRIDHQFIFLYSDVKPSSTYYGSSYRLSYYMPNEWVNHETDDIEAVKERVDVYSRIVDRIIEKMPVGLTNAQKCLYFVFVISAKCTYEDEQTTVMDEFQAYNVLVNGEAVCRGYADAFYYLCKREGIGCEVITGEAPSEGRHAWNRVMTGEGPMYIDITWYDKDWIESDFREGQSRYLFMTEEEMLGEGYEPDPD